VHAWQCTTCTRLIDQCMYACARDGQPCVRCMCSGRSLLPPCPCAPQVRNTAELEVPPQLRDWVQLLTDLNYQAS